SKADFRGNWQAEKYRVHGCRDVVVINETLPVLNLDDDLESWWRLALQYRLLRAAPSCFLVGKRDRLNAADKIGQRGVKHQVFESISMCCTNKLNTALRDRSRCNSLEFRPYLIDDDHL